MISEERFGPEIAQRLIDKESTIGLLDHFVESQNFIARTKERFGDPELGETTELAYFIGCEMVKRSARSNIDLIFDYSESPIESIFLNSLNFNSTVFGPTVPIYFCPPTSDTQNDIRNWRRHKFRMFWAFRKIRGLLPDSSSPELRFAEAAADMGIIPESSKWPTIAELMINTVLPVFDSPHVVVQAGFPNFKPGTKRGIRCDIFVWIPSHPQYKLIVELDGYQYHSNRQSFSRDRQRDRFLRSKGFDVLRFGGSEVNTNPVSTSAELLDYIRSTIPDIVRDRLYGDSLPFGHISE